MSANESKKSSPSAEHLANAKSLTRTQKIYRVLDFISTAGYSRVR
jgi:hypothetical protein